MPYQTRMTRLCTLACLSVLVCTNSPLFAVPLPRPEIPAIERDVHMSESRSPQTRPQFTRPTIPSLQTSADGRLGLGPKGQQENGRITFRLQVPEKIDQPFAVSPVGTGTDILALPNQLAPDFQGFNSNTLAGSNSSHVTLCDPSFDPDSSVKNPRACGIGDADDCYDVVIIRTDRQAGPPITRGIVGISTTVRVSNPKTVNARIAEVTSDRVVRGPSHTINAFFEPTTTADGRLLLARVNTGSRFTWRDSSGTSHTTNSDIVYFVNDNPDAFEACDVRQWDNVYPVTHAPYDTTINQRYGFASQLFRDTTGTVIPDGINLGTYGWIDKGGDNISLTTVGTALFDNQTGEVSDSTLDPQCVVTNCDSDADSGNGGRLNGRVMMGLWTRGKMVLLDNLINNIDFNTHGNDAAQRSLHLYEANGNRDGRVRIGNGRDNREERLPLGSSGTTTFFDSNEHRFNYLPNMRPVTPADVTWLISSGRGTHEVPFDDFTNPDTFIFANMAQVIEVTPSGVRRTVDGQVQNAAGGGRVTLNNPNNPTAGSGIPDTEWRIPTHGTILSADSRIEPIAMGGIHGKGFWLDGDGDGLEFLIPAQTRSIENTNWYYGLYVDARGNQSGDKAMLRYPDGSEIRLRDANTIVYTDTNGTDIHAYTIDEPVDTHQWRHYGFQISRESGSTRVVTYLNGYQVDVFTRNGTFLQLQANGTIAVGESPWVADMRAWIDEFKVIGNQVNAEVACNHASGTLAGITGNVSNRWNDWANNVPTTSHAAITNELNGNNQTSYSRYVCYNDYSDDLAAHLNNIPSGMTGIREAINFPEGPVLLDRPRPDSSNNRFCLACHTNAGKDGLTLAALTLDDSVNAPDDPRRQPMQPDPKVYGNIPANWLGNGLPELHTIAGPSGFLIDTLVLPSVADIDNSADTTPIPPSTDGDTNPPVTDGEDTTPPATDGDNNTPPATDGDNTTPPATGGDNTTPPATDGDNTTPPATGGDNTTPLDTGGESVTPPVTGDGVGTSTPISGGDTVSGPTVNSPLNPPPTNTGSTNSGVTDGDTSNPNSAENTSAAPTESAERSGGGAVSILLLLMLGACPRTRVVARVRDFESDISIDRGE